MGFPVGPSFVFVEGVVIQGKDFQLARWMGESRGEGWRLGRRGSGSRRCHSHGCTKQQPPLSARIVENLSRQMLNNLIALETL